MLFAGPYALAFWGLVVGIGILVPLALQALELRHRIPHTLVPALLVLAAASRCAGSWCRQDRRATSSTPRHSEHAPRRNHSASSRRRSCHETLSTRTSRHCRRRGGAWAQAPAARPTIPQVCTNCHNPQRARCRATFENVSFKSQAIQLKIDNVTEIVEVRSQDHQGDRCRRQQESPRPSTTSSAGTRRACELVEKDGAKWATLISFKGPIKIAPEKLINYAEVAKLVGAPPDKASTRWSTRGRCRASRKGQSRPAINLPYPAFDKLLDRLPQSKSSLLVSSARASPA